MESGKSIQVSIEIKPLGYRTLLGAYAVLRKSFPTDRRWYLHVLVSLNPWKCLNIPRLGGCELLQYWVAVQGKGVVGISGIYTSRLCPETVVWMGWTAVRPTHRRQGIARRLIDHITLVAKKIPVANIGGLHE